MRFSLFFFSLLFSLALTSCTRSDRAVASTVVSTAAPALCSVLTALVGPDGAAAGLVCADAAKLLSGALLLARVSPPPGGGVAVVSAPARACSPLWLSEIERGRDPREFVCAEVFSAPEVRRALGINHAR